MTQKRVGLLVGRETSFPTALMAEIQQRDSQVIAKLVKLNPIKPDDPVPYQVIIDRMSHEIPFYRAFVKYVALQGCYVMNNPFTWSFDDKFFGMTLLHTLKLPMPRAIILPNKTIDGDTSPENFGNLNYPLDWQGIIDYVGVPAIFKDAHTGGRRISYRVHNVDELIDRYDQSHTLTMILQQVVPAQQHIHCFVIGKDNVFTLEFSLDRKQYYPDNLNLDPHMQQIMEQNALAITEAYGYDVNMVEFAVSGDTYWVINPSNPAPDLDSSLLGNKAFQWCVNKMATLAIDLCYHPHTQIGSQPWRNLFDHQ